jgi:hypothetical protein
MLDIERNGAVVINNFPAGFPEPNGCVVPLANALDTGWVVRVRQHFGGATSDWSSPQTVRDHTVDYPAGPPRPVVNPAPVFKCGSRTGVGNLLSGANVWITANGVEVGRVNGATQQQGINVSPDYNGSQEVVAWSELCHDPSPPSAVEMSQLHSVPLATPVFESAQEGSSQLVLNALANGARFTIQRSGVDLGTFRTWGGRTIINLGSPIGASEPFESVQWLCRGDGTSDPGRTTSTPCSALRAPTVAPIQDGDMSVTLIDYIPDARIKVFVNLSKKGDGSGPVVMLSDVIQHGDTVHILQIVGTCVGSTVQEIHAACVAPPVGENPSNRNLFPVGTQPYDGGPISIRSNTTRIHGTVYYPAESDGSDKPFHNRLASLGPVPIVFLVHGRHATSPPTPSYLGYDYFQQQLARMGIIAVSVDCVDSDYWGGGATNIRDRAEIIIRSIDHFRSLNSGGDPVFGGRIDFTRVGLMGHSRGGEAVATVPEIISLPGVAIRGVISLAPVSSGAFSGSPNGYPAFLTILPAFDADLRDNPGAMFYDRALCSEFRCQLYVENANHNYFNRQWPDDTLGAVPLLPRGNHEAILSAYGCAFFRHLLLGHDTTAYLTGVVLPAGVATAKVQLSFTWSSGPLTVDSFEDQNTISTNSLGRPNTQASGLAADEFAFSQSGGPHFNNTFFGATTGMVCTARDRGGVFRSELRSPTSLVNREIWIRAAEVYNGHNVITPVMDFDCGVETTAGARAWVNSSDVGGLSLTQDRSALDSLTKTMPKTRRFPGACFHLGREDRITAILIRFNHNNPRPIAFDDIQIV